MTKAWMVDWVWRACMGRSDEIERLADEVRVSVQTMNAFLRGDEDLTSVEMTRLLCALRKRRLRGSRVVVKRRRRIGRQRDMF